MAYLLVQLFVPHLFVVNLVPTTDVTRDLGTALSFREIGVTGEQERHKLNVNDSGIRPGEMLQISAELHL